MIVIVHQRHQSITIKTRNVRVSSIIHTSQLFLTAIRRLLLITYCVKNNTFKWEWVQAWLWPVAKQSSGLSEAKISRTQVENYDSFKVSFSVHDQPYSLTPFEGKRPWSIPQVRIHWLRFSRGLNPEPHLLHMCSVHTDTQTHTASSYFTMLLNAINSRATSP